MKSILRVTGNPFVDAGIAALCALTKKDDPQKITKEELKEAVEELLHFYLSPESKTGVRWQGLHRFFTLNCKWTNPSYTNKTRDKECRYWIDELLDKVEPLHPSGTCAACGAREATTPAYTHESPLTGSGEFRNFFSFFDQGFPLCATCVLTIQFAPLTILSSPSSKTLLLLHSHEFEFTLLLAKKAIQSIPKRLDLELTYYWPPKLPTERELKLGKKPKKIKTRVEENFVRLVTSLLAEASKEFRRSVTMRLYRLINAGQITGLSYYDLPSEVFNFLRKAQATGLREELEEVFSHASPTFFEALIYRQRLGLVLSLLLDKENHRLLGGWKLFELYLKEVEKMNEDRIRILKETGDRLYEYLKSTNFKRLSDLEQADKYGELLMLLTRIQKETPLITVDELDSLFPSSPEGGVMWRETQAILLIRIYERMHKDGIKPKEV